MTAIEMTGEELLRLYLTQRDEPNEIRKKYSRLLLNYDDYLYREIEPKKASSYQDFVKESED